MKVIGSLLVLSSIISYCLWIKKHGIEKSDVNKICFLLVFVGLAFIFGDRITEISLPGLGTIKTAAIKATADANVITELKKSSEDKLEAVVKKVADVEQLFDDFSKKNSKAEEKLSQLNESINEGNLAVKELQLSTQFNTTILAAQNGNRPAYDQLLAWSEDSSIPFQIASAQAVQTIANQHNPAIIRSGFKVPWNEGVEPQKLSLSELRENFATAPPNIRLGILEFVWSKRTDIPKTDRLQFLVEVIRSDESLKVVEYAGRYFAEGTGDKYIPLATKQHLEWWEKNKDTIE